jgi:hypothetical protein
MIANMRMLAAFVLLLATALMSLAASAQQAAVPFVAADVAGGFVAGAALPPTICDLSNVRAAVADAKALVDKGDLAAARTRLKDLDKFWDGAVASSAPQTVARWRVIDRAIDRGLDRALLALRPRWPNAAMGDKALADLVAVVDQVRGKNQAGTDGGRLPSEAAPSQARADAASRRSQVRIPSAPPGSPRKLT